MSQTPSSERDANEEELLRDATSLVPRPSSRLTPGSNTMAITNSSRDTVEILKFLYPVRHKWYEIGTALEIDKATLQAIQKVWWSDLLRCLREVIEEWQKSIDPLPTWEILANTLENKFIDEPRLAREALCKGHLSPENVEQLRAAAAALSSSGDPPLSHKLGASGPFTYLKLRSQGNIDKLRVRLEVESRSTQYRFANLVGKAVSTIASRVDVTKVKTFFSAAGIEELHAIGSQDTVTDILSKVTDRKYWTFLDYELLENLIRAYCDPSEPIITTLNKYIEDFNDYCRRRIYEVPADCLRNDTIPVEDQSIICLKTDPHFSASVKVGYIKHVEHGLSKLLGIDLHLLCCEHGCVELTFNYFKELKIKIAEQMVELVKMDLQWIMCFHTSTDDEDPAAGPSAITLIHFPGYDAPFNVNNVEEENSTAILPANVRNFKISPSLIADSLPVARMCARCPAVDLNVTDGENQTALIRAAGRKDNIEVVRTLLQQNVIESSRIDIDHKDNKGRTAIHAAAENENWEILEYLLEKFPASRTAVEEGDPVLVVLPKKQQDILGIEPCNEPYSPDSSDVNIKSEIGGKEIFPVQESSEVQEVQDAKSFNLITRLRKERRLMSVSKRGDHATVEKLLKDGINPDTKNLDRLRWTPLMWASHRGFTKTVEVLLEYKADPNIPATNGFTALILASRKGNHEVVRLLVGGKKANIMARNDIRGWSALMWASQTYPGVAGTKKDFITNDAMKNRRIVAEHLLKAADESNVDLVNLEANNGWTPLMQAGQDGDVEMVKTLIAAGANLDHQSKSSWSALTTACRKGNEEIVEVLVNAGASVDLLKKGGVTALHIACYQGLDRAMRSLIKGKDGGQGADVNKKDNWGMTPLMLAVKHKKKIQYLVEEAKATLSFQAEKYALWNAYFFAIKNKDMETAEYLLKNDNSLKDQHAGQSFGSGIELLWRARQLPNLVLNI